MVLLNPNLILLILKKFWSTFMSQAHNAMEMVMERLAYELNMDPLEFRTKNFLKKGDRMVKGFVPRMIKDNPLPAMIETLKQSSKYLERKVELEQFNQVIWDRK